MMLALVLVLALALVLVLALVPVLLRALLFPQNGYELIVLILPPTVKGDMRCWISSSFSCMIVG